jgi:hypothetical protein
MGQVFVGDVRLVGGIEEQDGLMFLRVRDPRCELRVRGDSAGRIVRETEIDHVHSFSRRFGNEAVRLAAREVQEARVCAGRIGFAGATRHHIRVHVDRVHRVRDRDAVLRSQNIKDVSAVTF